MFDIACWDKYDFSVFCICRLSPFIQPLECVTMFEDVIINNKTLEQTTVVFIIF